MNVNNTSEKGGRGSRLRELWNRSSSGWNKIFLLIMICILLFVVFLSFIGGSTLNLFSTKNAFPEPQDQSQVKVSAGTLFTNKSNEGAGYIALVVDTANLNLYLADDKGQRFSNFQNLKSWLSKNKQEMTFAMNAGIYGRDFQPLGLHVENGKLIRKLNLSNEETTGDDKNVPGNFFMVPNGVFMVKDGEASIVESNLLKDVADWENARFATQSGPLLLLNGEIHPKFKQASTNRRIRNGVGIIDKKSVVFIITKDPVTFYDFTMIFKDKFNCKDALYLDGEISKIYISEFDGDNNTKADAFAGMFAASIPVSE